MKELVRFEDVHRNYTMGGETVRALRGISAIIYVDRKALINFSTKKLCKPYF